MDRGKSGAGMVSTTSLNLLAHEQRVIELFDNSAPSYANGYCDDSSTSHFFKRRQEIIVDLLGELRGGKLLDVGCGPGLMAKRCLDAGFFYSGVDISPRMIAECHKRFPDQDLASFSVGKMQSLPFPSALFDVLLCMGALEYVLAREESRAISELARVIRPGGCLIVSCLNESSPYWMFDRNVNGAADKYYKLAKRMITVNVPKNNDREAVPQRMVTRTFSVRKFRCLLTSHGFTIVDTLYYGVNILPPPLDEKFPRVAARASGRLEGLANGPLKRLAMAFIIVARKASGGAEEVSCPRGGPGVTAE